MAETAIGCAPAPVIPFNPAAWLARFRDVGGWWILGSDGKPFIGWRLNEPDDIGGDQPRALWRDVAQDRGKRDAISAHLLAAAGEGL